jgi:hypothetical protein
MERTLEQNMAAAWEAVRFVKGKMRLGARNQLGDLFRSSFASIDCISDLRSDVDTYASTLDNLFSQNERAAVERIAEYTASAAAHYGCGNCNEQAALAFVYLRDKKVFPIDWVDKLGVAGGGLGGHSFVVVGRIAAKTKPGEWGPTAVICDPHETATAFPASEIEQHWPRATLKGKIRLEDRSSGTIKLAY